MRANQPHFRMLAINFYETYVSACWCRKSWLSVDLGRMWILGKVGAAAEPQVCWANLVWKFLLKILDTRELRGCENICINFHVRQVSHEDDKCYLGPGRLTMVLVVHTALPQMKQCVSRNVPDLSHFLRFWACETFSHMKQSKLSKLLRNSLHRWNILDGSYWPEQLHCSLPWLPCVTSSAR